MEIKCCYQLNDVTHNKNYFHQCYNGKMFEQTLHWEKSLCKVMMEMRKVLTHSMEKTVEGIKLPWWWWWVYAEL